MRERQARRQWQDPTAEIAISRAQRPNTPGELDLFKLDTQIAEAKARLRANGAKARNRKLRNLIRLRKQLIWGGKP